MYEQLKINCLNENLEKARNTLKYTIQLHYDMGELRQHIEGFDNNDKITYIINYMNTFCSALFSSSISAKQTIFSTDDLFAGLNGSFLFFGDPKDHSSNDTIKPGPLCCLDENLYHRVWGLMLGHHCLLATYDKLRDIIFGDASINMYHLILDFYDWGFDYAMQHSTFKMTTSNDRFTFESGKKNACPQTQAASYMNSYVLSFSSLKNLLSSAKKYSSIGEKIFDSDNETDEKKIPVNMIPLFQQLRGRTRSLQPIFRLYDNTNDAQTQRRRNKDCEKIISFIRSLYDTIQLSHNQNESCMSPVDTLFYKYKLDQTFYFDLAWCLTRNIQALNDRFNQRFEDSASFIDIVTGALHLPNTVSRSLLVQMAFDCCSDDRKAGYDFFTSRIIHSDDAMYFDKRRLAITDQHNTLDTWEKRYNRFINYMTSLVFPVYESYFFVMMYDIFSESKQSLTENIYALYEILNDYLSAHSNEIKQEYYRDEIINLHNQKPKSSNDLNVDDFILADYPTSIDDDKSFPSLFSKVVLSIYNHMSDPVPSLINLYYLHKVFGHAEECFLTSYIKDLI